MLSDLSFPKADVVTVDEEVVVELNIFQTYFIMTLNPKSYCVICTCCKDHFEMNGFSYNLPWAMDNAAVSVHPVLMDYVINSH